MENQETKKRIITLTGRKPVRINEDEWPVIAVATANDHDNQYEFQANRKWKNSIRVREHADGRKIIYGVSEYISHFQNEKDYLYKAGELLSPEDDIPKNIYRVAETLTSLGAPEDVFTRLAEECLSDLPAEDI